MIFDGEEYIIENPKYYLVVLEQDGESISELIFTRKAILEYLGYESNTEEIDSGI